MLRRRIAKPPEPCGGPDDADRTDDDEAGAPAPARDQPEDERHADHAADARAEENRAVGLAAFRHRKPSRDRVRRARQRPGFAGPAKKWDRAPRATGCR